MKSCMLMKNSFKTLGQWILTLLISGICMVSLWRWAASHHAIQETRLPQEHRLECASYTPFIGEEGPWQLATGLIIPEPRLDHDLQILSQKFDCIRIYSATGMDAVLPLAQKYGIKVILGAWINRDPLASLTEVFKTILLAQSHPDAVKAIVVGNETLLRKEVPSSQLILYIQMIKASLPQAPVTYADVWEFWLKYPEVAAAVDFVTIHILPYWEDAPIGIDHAVEHVEAIRTRLQNKFPDKKIFIGETGWPSWGRTREAASPSPLNQARFIRGFVQLAESKGWEYNLIEAFDQPWKRFNEGAVGGYWGMFTEGRRAKPLFDEKISFISDWTKWAALTLIFFLIAIPFAWKTPRSFWGATAILTFVPFLLGLQLYDFDLILRNDWEWTWGIFLLGLGMLCLIATLRVNHEKAPEKYEGALFWIFNFLLITTCLCFIVDGRYRSFPTFAFIPGMVLGVVHAQQRRSFARRRETPLQGKYLLFGHALIVLALWILILETPLNAQAVWWCALVFITARSHFHLAGLPFTFTLTGTQSKIIHRSLEIILWPWWYIRQLRSALQIATVRRFLILLTLSGLTFGLVRYRLMESVPLAEMCYTNQSTWCGLRDFIGMLIYFQFFGKLALGLTLLALVARHRKTWQAAAIVLGMAGLLLYNFDLAAAVLALNLFLLSSPGKGNS